MKSKAETLLEQIAQENPTEPTCWGFDGDLLDGKATWNEMIDGQECIVRLLMTAISDLEVNYSWPRSHYMRGVFLIVDPQGISGTYQYKNRHLMNKNIRSYIYIPCLRASTEKIQSTYTELFMNAKSQGTAGLSFPGSDWEYSRFLT